MQILGDIQFKELDLINVVVTLSITGLLTLITQWIKQLMAQRRHQLKGDWYCLEYVPNRGETESDRNVYTKVTLKPKLGGRWSVKVIDQYDLGAADRDWITRWTLIGRISHGNMLIGNWESDVPNTTRYGCAQIEFFDTKALGYWLGPSRNQHIVYGYWIMSKEPTGLEDIKAIGNQIQNSKKFVYADVIKYVMDETNFLKAAKGAPQ